MVVQLVSMLVTVVHVVVHAVVHVVVHLIVGSYALLDASHAQMPMHSSERGR